MLHDYLLSVIEDISLCFLAREETERVVAGHRDLDELSVVTGHSSRLVDLAVVVGLVRAESQAGLDNTSITQCITIMVSGLKQPL